MHTAEDSILIRLYREERAAHIDSSKARFLQCALKARAGTEQCVETEGLYCCMGLLARWAMQRDSTAASQGARGVVVRMRCKASFLPTQQQNRCIGSRQPRWRSEIPCC